MIALLPVSIHCEPDRAAHVVRAASTHPNVTASRYDEQLRVASLLLDLGTVTAYADRQCERERVQAWMTWCHDRAEACTWEAWCAYTGRTP